jgi:hypothetical protein
MGAIGGVGRIAGSLARSGHGGAHGQPSASAEHSGQSRRGNASGRGAIGHEERATISGNDLQAAAQREAFEAALRSVAIQLVNDSIGDLDDTLVETEEDS